VDDLAKTGHCHVRLSLGEWFQLGNFVPLQWANHRKGALSGECYDKLFELGLDFKSENARVWEVRFQQLAGFCREHRHFDVPDTNKPMQGWVMIQRDQYRLKIKRLTECRIQRLQAIDFAWEPLVKRLVKVRR
jgi:hypothetical protein